jgi:hypothetical protein
MFFLLLAAASYNGRIIPLLMAFVALTAGPILAGLTLLPAMAEARRRP